MVLSILNNLHKGWYRYHNVDVLILLIVGMYLIYLKKYDEYYHEFKTNVKMQIRALEEIMRHLNDVLKEYIQNQILQV